MAIANTQELPLTKHDVAEWVKTRRRGDPVGLRNSGDQCLVACAIRAKILGKDPFAQYHPDGDVVAVSYDEFSASKSGLFRGHAYINNSKFDLSAEVAALAYHFDRTGQRWHPAAVGGVDIGRRLLYPPDVISLFDEPVWQPENGLHETALSGLDR